MKKIYFFKKIFLKIFFKKFFTKIFLVKSCFHEKNDLCFWINEVQKQPYF